MSAIPVSAIKVGCSGWVYRHWKGGFYPTELPQRRWFDHYAQEFDTVEINASFYRLPLASTFAKWRNQAPSGFCYAVKANRFLTHMKKLKECDEPTEEFLSLILGLGPALGPILYQLPPSLAKDLDRLEAFLALLPADLTHVFEFRRPDWYDRDVLDLLDRHGAGFVVHDMPGSVTPRWASGKVAYARFHGTAGKYRGRYGKERLEDWAGWLTDQAGRGRAAFAYFNNDIGGDAIADAKMLRDLVSPGSARE